MKPRSALDVSERQKAFKDAAYLCRSYANWQLDEKPEWKEVALECAAILEEEAKLVLTITKNGYSPCQELFNFLKKPKIDYTSGLRL